MNIYQKLIEVRKSVPYLQKDNVGHQFKYVSSSQTLGALKAEMDAQGLLLIPSVKSERVLDHTTSKGAHWYFTVLTVEFTWINAELPEERITCQWTGQGLDDGEKGVGKALTYAEKFFMLKFFNIPTDKDDPDSFQKDTSQKAEKRTVPSTTPQEADPNETKTYAMHPNEAKDVPESLGEQGLDEALIIADLKKAVSDLMGKAGIKTKESKKDFFDWFMVGKDMTVDNIMDLKDNFIAYKGEYLKAKDQFDSIKEQ
jgi:hypothetical protein